MGLVVDEFVRLKEENMMGIVDLIWWIITITILPLDGSIVWYYIEQNNFGGSFWFTLIIYIFLSINVAIRLYIMEIREGK